MKAFSAGLAAALATPARRLRKGVIVTRLDGTVIRFTDGQMPREIGGHVYYPGKGVQIASIAMQINSTTTRWDKTVSDSFIMSKNDLRAGLYDKAEVEVFLYDEGDPNPDPTDLLFKGTFGSIEVTQHGYTRIECVGPLDRSLAQISFTYGPVCRRDLGDSSVRSPLGLPGCPVHIHPFETSPWVYEAEVVSAGPHASGYQVVITDPGNPDAALDWYALGRIVVRDGYLKGKVYPIRTNPNTTTLHLFRPPVVDLEPGTSLWVIPGCDKTLGPNGHLKFNANGYLFDAEPYAPGDESRLRTMDTQGSPTLSFPLDLNFATGTYTADGETIALEDAIYDVWTKASGYPFNWQGEVTPGAGVVNDGITDLDDDPQGIFLKESLVAELVSEGGAVVIVDYTSAGSTPGSPRSVGVGFHDIASFNWDQQYYQYGQIAEVVGYDPDNSIWIFESRGNSATEIPIALMSAGAGRMAISLTLNGAVAASVNGGTVQGEPAGMSVTGVPTDLTIYGEQLTISRVRISIRTGSENLQSLSAL